MMKKANLILELMHEMDVTLRDLMEASKCIKDGRFSLPLYIDEKTIVDDPTFFEEHPRALPQGVVIEKKLYPFSNGKEDKTVDPLNHYKNYTRIKKCGVVFPSVEELKPLADKFLEYKALAGCFNLLPYTRCVLENEEGNNDVWIHYYDLVGNKEEAHNAACPYFRIKNLS